MNITKDQLITAFTKWITNIDDNPDKFYQEVILTPGEFVERSVDYLISLIDQEVNALKWPHDGATVEVIFPAGHRPGDITRKATYDREAHTFTMVPTGGTYGDPEPIEARWFTGWRYFDDDTPKPTELTDREKWLMGTAYQAAQVGLHPYCSNWLNCMTEVEGVTVEMVIMKDAPQ